MRSNKLILSDLLKTSAGTLASQIIGVISIPLLARLYGPASYGQLAAFVSIATVINVFSSLRFEYAIPLQEDDDHALDVACLCISLVLLVSASIAILSVYLHYFPLIPFLHSISSSSLLWLMPVFVFFSGSYQVLSYLAIRARQFGKLSALRVVQSGVLVIISLILYPLGPSGLVIGQIASQVSGGLHLYMSVASNISSRFRVSRNHFPELFKRYLHFAVFTTPAGLINVFSNQAPVLFFTFMYGSSSVGQFSICQRITLLPVLLIGSSISQVIKGYFSRNLHADLPRFFKQSALILFLVSLVIAFATNVVLAPLLEYVMGTSWTSLRLIIAFLTPVMIGKLVVSSLSSIFHLLEKNSSELVAQAFVASLRSAGLIVALLIHADFSQAVLIFSVFSFAGYCGYGLALTKVIRNSTPTLDYRSA